MQERGRPSTGVTHFVCTDCLITGVFKVFCEKSFLAVCFACSNTDVHTVASLLKLYLRQLPEPLVPYSRYQEFLLCGQQLSSDRTLVTAALDATPPIETLHKRLCLRRRVSF